MKDVMNRSRTIRISLIVVSAAVCIGFGDAAPAAPPSVTGYDVAIEGTTKGIPSCASCHGNDGQGRLAVGIPRLAGLSEFYLDRQLRYFADGKRVNDIMTPYAKLLTPEERHAVAEYFAAMPVSNPVTNPGFMPTRVQEVEFSRGKDLAENGIWQHAMPACGLCHGATGAGVGAEFPALAGQSRGYLIAQLDAWKANRRRTPLGKFMRAVAVRMSKADIQAAATYYALLPKIPKQGGDPK